MVGVRRLRGHANVAEATCDIVALRSAKEAYNNYDVTKSRQSGGAVVGSSATTMA